MAFWNGVLGRHTPWATANVIWKGLVVHMLSRVGGIPRIFHCWISAIWTPLARRFLLVLRTVNISFFSGRWANYRANIWISWCFVRLSIHFTWISLYGAVKNFNRAITRFAWIVPWHGSISVPVLSHFVWWINTQTQEIDGLNFHWLDNFVAFIWRLHHLLCKSALFHWRLWVARGEGTTCCENMRFQSRISAPIRFLLGIIRS